MFQRITFKSTLLATLIGAVSIAIPARATVITLSFNGSGAADNTFQQTSNSPCVIGDPSCNEPSGMTYFSSAGPTNPYDFFSPIYTAMNPFTTFSGNLIPTTFMIGVDENIAKGAGAEVLAAFNVFSCTTTNVSSCTTLVASLPSQTVPNNNNGNGFSDATISGFSLVSGTRYIFEANVTNDSDGMEEFFIIPAGTPSVPEPVTSALVGSGLIALFFVRRRVRS